MISVITVNWNAYEWLNLMLESLELFSSLPYKVVVVDNSIHKIDVPNILQHKTDKNIGHGAGLNLGVKIEKEKIGNPFVMFLDIDCHIITHNWEEPFILLMDKFDVLGGRGVPEKPIRPACMFMKPQIAQKYDWRDTPGYKGVRVTPEGFDVAIQAFHQMNKDNVSIRLLEAKENRYGTLNGEEFMIDNNPLIYHHWHGSHLVERQIDFPTDDLIQDKKLLFSKIPWRVV